MQGRILKGIAGFYYVAAGHEIYECKALGIFRKNQVKPLVGDGVELQILDEDNKKGNITKILPRSNELIRPAAANVDQALIVFSMTSPEPNLNLLDRFLILMEQKNLPCIICFNKSDLATPLQQKKLEEIYGACGHRLVFISVKSGSGVDELKEMFLHKITTAAGPSGVGKSSLINSLQLSVQMETGEISEKIGRGKHTTRHAELIAIDEDSYIVDTPGFSSLQLSSVQREELKTYYGEFAGLEDCRFQTCVHIHEPDCMVKKALLEGAVHPVRYENYKQLFEELSDRKKYERIPGKEKRV